MKADNKKIWIRGQFVEVTDEVYAAYMKGDRKIRYFENDLKTGRTVKDKDGNIKQTLPSREDSLDRLMEDNAQQFLDSHESVEDDHGKYIICNCRNRGKGSRSVKTLCLQISSSDE